MSSILGKICSYLRIDVIFHHMYISFSTNRSLMWVGSDEICRKDDIYNLIICNTYLQALKYLFAYSWAAL